MLFGKGKGEDPLVLLQQGKFKEAAKVLEARLQKSPHDLSLKMRLADAYEGAGRKEDAAAIYVAEADADLGGGDRAQALGLLKKASRLLPADEDLKVRILKLEGQPEASSDQSFSFDVDMSSAEESVGSGAPGQAAGGEVPVPEAPVPEVEIETEAAGPAFEEPIGLGPADPAEGSEQIPEIEGSLESPVAPTMEAEILEVDAEALKAEVISAPAEDEPGPEPPRAVLARLFPELSAAHLDLLARVLREGWVTAGKVLIREEEAGDSMFVVTSGRLEARGHFDGRELLLASFGPGDIIGEVAFLNRVPRTATVTAVEDSTYVELPGDEVRSQLAEVPETLALLQALLEQRVEKTLQLLKKADQ